LRVLALASYPNEAAATRYRVTQFAAPLAGRGIELRLSPFLDARQFLALYEPGNFARKAAGLAASALRRLRDVPAARRADVLFVQREAMTLGPPVVEWLAARALGRPMVLDLDDATYVRYVSPTYGRLGSALKWFRKTDDLIRWSSVVTCGNRFIAEYVRSRGARAVVVPTVVDTDLFRPRERPRAGDGVPVLGWIGTHSTYPYLETVFPVLRQLARSHKFRLKVIGAGRERIDLEGVEVENLKWSLRREVDDFRSFDVGLYPIIPDEWSAGKSGFKSIQYMAVGVPFVVTPFGAAAEIGEAGATHFAASTPAQWGDALARLLSDAALRRRMGEAGRRHASAFYSLPAQADKLAAALREAARPG
jgi:glycosyltransferase involved in cell wall biosynthesis